MPCMQWEVAVIAHTPGPWHWVNSETDLPREDGEWRSSLRTVKEYPRASSSGIFLPIFILEADEIYGENMEGNALLIAAAPELLEALVMVRDADEDCKRDGLPTIPAPARAKIDAAIAKATMKEGE